MRNAKEINAALDQLHAQVFALSNWVVTLAALHPASSVALLSLPKAAQNSLLFAGQSDAQIERCVQALRTLSSAFAETRVSMAQEDMTLYSPKPGAP